MSGPTPFILIVDDHPLFRDALETALHAAFPGAASSSHASSVATARSEIDARAPDMILLDLNLPDAIGFEGLGAIKAVAPETPVVIVSATETPEAFTRARDLGAAGYMPKSLALEEMSAVLVTVLDGGTWFPETPDAGQNETNELAARLTSLTPAQRRVLSGLSEGLLNKQIAYEMSISTATVKAHMTAIFRKLGVQNRTQALLAYKTAVLLSDHSAA